MTDKIDTFAQECRDILADGATPEKLDEVRKVVEKYLKDADFVQEQLGPHFDDVRDVLYEDPDLGFCICRHVFKGYNEAPPHDHGPTWAIYGQAMGTTTMTEFKMVEPPQGGTPGKVEPTKTYDLEPGMAVAYPTGALHSPKREGDTRLIRMEGRDVTKLSRDAYAIA
ncbi:MAG: hypothetical protein JJ899_09905 [Alphaproteobacteria bacterium]|nr:hypothetical protein [Alphaproteobacteria bacterium]